MAQQQYQWQVYLNYSLDGNANNAQWYIGPYAPFLTAAECNSFLASKTFGKDVLGAQCRII